MKRSLLTSLLTAALTLMVIPAHADPASAVDPSATAHGSSIRFEENRGQWDSTVLFRARTPGYDLFLTAAEAVLVRRETPDGAAHPLRIRFPDQARPARVHGLQQTRGLTHSIRGQNPDRWVTGIRGYSRVRYEELLPGIDLEFYDRGGVLEFDAIVAPGADPQPLQFEVVGHDRLEIDENGDLLLHAGPSTIRLHAPVITQNLDEATVTVPGRYALQDDRFGFEIAAYDRSRALVIDPIVTDSSLIGGSGDDGVLHIAVDDDRSTILTGFTTSGDFPTTAGTVQPQRNGATDIFVTKLSPMGEPIWSTFLGGSASDEVTGIRVDSSGTIWIAGFTASADFPTTAGSLQPRFAGGTLDAILVRLAADGSRLMSSTFLGGSGTDRAFGLAIGSRGEAIVVGETSSDDFPVTENAFQPVRNGGFDEFITTVSRDGKRLLASTLLGGGGDDRALAVDLDAAGFAYVAGWIQGSSDFPVTESAFQTMRPGRWDGAVSKLSADGSTLVYSSYLGGSDDEIAVDLQLDASGQAHVGGLTCSNDFPTTPGAFQEQKPGDSRSCAGFVSQFAPDGRGVNFSTYFGGSQGQGSQRPNVDVKKLGFDPEGRIWLAGSTTASNLPVTDDAYQGMLRGPGDGYLARLDRTGSELLYGTYLGGDGNDTNGAGRDHLWAFAIDNGGTVRFGGSTRSPAGFPTTDGAFQPLFAGGAEDGFFGFLSPDRQSIEGARRVIPVVGSLEGRLGSFFKTTVQLHNTTDSVSSGRIVFHPQAVPGRADDPSIDFFLGPFQTIAFSDLLPVIGTSGIGSVDVILPDGESLRSVIRIFNDAGEEGTSGMTETLIRPDQVLTEGEEGILIAADDLVRLRFNIGIRTLDEGAVVSMTVRAADGTVIHETTRDYPADWFQQGPASDFLGFELSGNESITFSLSSGSAILYGTTTDNTTHDPNLQIAQKPQSVAGERRVVPVIGSLEGKLGSFFRTSVQLHNPYDQSIEGRLVYHAAGTTGADTDPFLAYVLEPRQTIAVTDILTEIGLSGMGSADLIATLGSLPVSVTRIFNDAGEGGTSGMTEPQISESQILGEGERGVLIAPFDPVQARLNIGIRTMEHGARIEFRVRSAAGNEVVVREADFPASYFQQTSAEDLLGIELSGNDVIEIRVLEGNAVVYGATVDNVTHDPSLQFAHES